MAKGQFKYPVDLESMTKECSICHKIQDITEFTKNKNFHLGRSTYCRTCINTRQRAWREKAVAENPDFVQRRLHSQKKHKAKMYGLTVEQFDKLFDDCGGLCEICREGPTMTAKSSSSLHVDHCHVSGIVRGI